MSDVNFYLKKPINGKSLIFLQFKYHGNVLRYSSKQFIEPVNWNKKKQRVKSSISYTKDGKFLINDLLDEMVNVVKRSYNGAIKNGIPTPAYLKEQLNNFLNYNLMEEERKSAIPTLLELADQFIEGKISYKGKLKSPKSLQNYRSTKLHLLEFSKNEKFPIMYDTVNLNLFDRLTTYLAKKKGLAHNTIAKTIAVLKTFMNYANECSYTTNKAHTNKKFSMPEKETDAVYLSIPELIKLYQYDFSGNKKLERVRDFFIVGALTGLRFSDFSRIQKENFVQLGEGLFLKIRTAKTDQLIIIPVNPVILKIMEKYDNNLPPSLSNQKFNNYIKEVCRLAGMVETGRLHSSPEKELWQLISSHTCRRSMCTNLHIGGVNSYSIMAISGHRTERSFLKYIKISKLETAKQLREHIDIATSQFFLKAVV